MPRARATTPPASECTRLVRDAEALNTAVWPVPPEQHMTPTERFFTRSHAQVPAVDPATWRVEVGGLVRRPRSFSLADLAGNFPRHTVAATLVCAGLRRDELLSIAPLPGELPWGPEPASTGRWSGFALRDLLEAVEPSDAARHVEFVGLDRVERHERRFGFGGSIELEKARTADVLLADELNGAALTADHGFPLRTVVPGWIGARSVKWLGRITLCAEPSGNYFQRRAYRVQREVNPRDPRDVTAGVALSVVPINAVVLYPTSGQVVPAGPVRVHGWAMGEAGQAVRSVEVSGDGGAHWIAATLAPRESAWTWTLWEATVRLASGPHTIVARATDAAGTVQPATLRETWNVKGYNNNAWHRVAIRAE
jgi:sulfite oxidase